MACCQPRCLEFCWTKFTFWSCEATRRKKRKAGKEKTNLSLCITKLATASHENIAGYVDLWNVSNRVTWNSYFSGHSVWSGGRWAMYLPAFLLTIVQRSLHGALTSARLSVQLLKKPRLLWSSRTQMSEVLHLPLPQSLPLLKTVNISRIKMWHYNGGRFTITAQNRQNLKKKNREVGW